jgi:putative inorganic carbon (HCO3(-)) transporter
LASFSKGPIFGLLTYYYTYYTQFTWGRQYMRERWSFYVSIAVLLSYLLKKNAEKYLSHFEMPQLKWLIFYIVNMVFVGFFAVDPDGNKKELVAVVKLTVLYYLTICIVRTKLHYKMFLWVQVWGNFLFGWHSYGKKLTGGRLEGVGGPQTRTSNDLANHLVMILPFFSNMFFSGSKWEKIAVICAAPWVINALVLCNSRGAFLGMLAMAFMSLARAPKKIRKKMLFGVILGGILFVHLADDRFWERMDTLKEGTEKSSGRIEAWKGAIPLIEDHPFGVGGNGFVYLSPVYIPEIVAAHNGEKRSVHNTYLKVITNFGIQGFALYVAFIVSTLRQLRNMRKRTGSKNDNFYHMESTAIEISIWGFLITATFGSRPYFETLFWYCSIASALNNIQQSELKDMLKKEKGTSKESLGTVSEGGNVDE